MTTSVTTRYQTCYTDINGRSASRSRQGVFTLVSFVLILCLGPVGCRRTPFGPPTRHPTIVFQAIITHGGMACGPGWLTLMPVAGTVGDHVVVPIGSDGTVQCDHAPVGRVQVRIQLVNPPTDRGIKDRLSLLRGPGSPVVTDTSVLHEPFRFDIRWTPMSPR